MKNLEEKIEPVVIILDEEDDFDFEETDDEIQAEYEAECLADDTQDVINWINESNTLAEYVSMEFENMNQDDLGASLENASQCLDAIVKDDQSYKKTESGAIRWFNWPSYSQNNKVFVYSYYDKHVKNTYLNPEKEVK